MGGVELIGYQGWRVLVQLDSLLKLGSADEGPGLQFRGAWLKLVKVGVCHQTWEEGPSPVSLCQSLEGPKVEVAILRPECWLRNQPPGLILLEPCNPVPSGTRQKLVTTNHHWRGTLMTYPSLYHTFKWNSSSISSKQPCLRCSEKTNILLGGQAMSLERVGTKPSWRHWPWISGSTTSVSWWVEYLQRAEEKKVDKGRHKAVCLSFD